MEDETKDDKKSRTRSALVVVLSVVAAALVMTVAIGMCEHTNFKDDPSYSAETAAVEEPAGEEAATVDDVALAPVYLPIAWVAGVDWAEDGAAVGVLYLPGHDLAFTRDGSAISQDDPDYPQVIDHDVEQAVVCLDGRQYQVSTDHLLVNLAQFLPNAVIDAVYSYSAPSDCAGHEIPGLTGCRVDGYADGAAYDPYLGRDAFAVPASYSTYEKLLAAEAELSSQGYRLLIWDCYRPWRGSVFISDRFKEAYAQDAAIQASLGQWSLSWYAADGASGHNFGSDVDLSLVDLDGNPVSMPSHFDAFDSSAHLTTSPVSSSSITEDAYTDAVSSNAACMALHRAMRDAGFSELASEWWHFGDDEGEGDIAALVGAGGMDFTAEVASCQWTK